MPFIPNTPESSIARSDSKNPLTTCRGITSGGRPCRRPVTIDDNNGNPTPPPRNRRMANLRIDDPSDESLYCWQHKEQASLSARSSPGPRALSRHTPILEERTSLDTLADRLGLVEISQEEKRKSKKRRTGTTDGAHSSGGYSTTKKETSSSRPKPRTQTLFCCCFSIPLEEQPAPRPIRPKPHPLQQSDPGPAKHAYQNDQFLGAPSASRPQRSRLPGSVVSSSGSPASSPGGSRYGKRCSPAPSPTEQFMSLIPATSSPQTAASLLAELAKPVSQLDEAGYIYMFWLTPESKSTASAAAPGDAAKSLLAPPPSTPTKAGRQRRPSDVIASFTSTDGNSSGKGGRRLLLKIGRANNVQRRLNEWKRQCGYELSLVRYYPYIPSSSSPSPSGSPAASPRGSSSRLTPRKMPHSHKVERLVHIELSGLGLRVSDREKCGACGREHREWFEVDGSSRKGIEAVDEVIRRWVAWDEGTRC